MKKRNMAALTLVAVMLLTACGRAADTTVTTEQMVVPEMSSKDMLVNSLEYLLEEEPVEETEGKTGEEEQEAAEADNDTAGGDDAQQTAVICYGKDIDSDLEQEEIKAEEITPDVLLDALARHNIVPLLDTKALSMEEKKEDGKKLLCLDISGSFREYLMTMSVEAESIIISSIVNTFLSNYDADLVYITVEGEALSTSHAEYKEALPGCTPREMMAYLTAAEEAEPDEN